MRRRFVLLPAAIWLALAAGVPGCRTPERSPLDLFRGGPKAFDVVLDGNTSFGRRRLLHEAEQSLLEFAENDFRKYAVDDAAYSLEQFYEAQGFAAAEVGYELLTEGLEKPRVRFEVHEGPRTELDEVRFAGNEEFDAKSLSRLVVLRGKGLLGRGKVWYSRSKAEAGRSRLEGLYFERGYLEVQVTLVEPLLYEQGTKASLLYVIQQGPQYRLREVRLDGVPQEWLAAARETYAEMIGEPWFPRISFEIEAKIKDVAANRGHPEARADSVRIEGGDPGDIRLELSLEPGEEIRVGKLLISGNKKTSESFIRARIEVAEGQLYDRSEQRASFRNLYETGIFNRVRLSLEGSEPGVRDLRVEVTEGPTLEVYGEPGWGSYEELRFKAGITESNLFGTGRRLSFSGTVAMLAQNAVLRFTEPNVFGPHTNIDVEGFAGRREEPSFTREDIGAAIQLRHRFTRKVSSTLRYERVDSRAVEIQVDAPADIADNEDVKLSLVSLTPSYDSRNAPFLPTRGTLGRFTVEVSDPGIGSELGYLRLLGNFAHYFPISPGSVVAASVRTGVLLATDGTELFPIQLRFFNGGENTVRSFEESQLGPKDTTGEPVGGEVYNVFSVEYRRDLVSRLQGALFFDAGNVLFRAQDYGSFDDLRYAVGIGVRWVLPIGPIRLDLGINPDPELDEESWVLHFSLGTAY